MRRKSPGTPAVQFLREKAADECTVLSRRTRRERLEPENRDVRGLAHGDQFITSIPALFLYGSILNHSNYIIGAGADAHGTVALGAFLEMVLIIANVGTAVVLFPILKRQNETAALGYVTARLVESTFIAVGIVSMLATLTVREDGNPGASAALGKALIAIHDWTFLLGPGFVVGVGNGLILGYLMYRSGLVPRRLAMFGLIGGPLICASGTLVIFNAIDAGGPVQFLATVPEFIWELGFGVYLIVKGFLPSPILNAGVPKFA